MLDYLQHRFDRTVGRTPLIAATWGAFAATMIVLGGPKPTGWFSWFVVIVISLNFAYAWTELICVWLRDRRG